MRQIADLLVWAVLVMVLAAAVYFTPRFAEYMSNDGREPEPQSLNHSLAFNPSNVAEAAH